jgi:hypothetical protein
MKKECYDEFDGVYTKAVFVVVFDDMVFTDSWYPDVLDERQLGKMFEDAHYGQDVPRFRVYDADERGNLVECRLENVRLERDMENDYAAIRTNIVSCATNEVVGVAHGSVDLRA